MLRWCVAQLMIRINIDSFPIAIAGHRAGIRGAVMTVTGCFCRQLWHLQVKRPADFIAPVQLAEEVLHSLEAQISGREAQYVIGAVDGWI